MQAILNPPGTLTESDYYRLPCPKDGAREKCKSVSAVVGRARVMCMCACVRGCAGVSSPRQTKETEEQRG